MMAKVGLLYNGAGEVVGHTFCGADDDFKRQVMPEGRAWKILEVEKDHPAVADPRRQKAWEIVTVAGKVVSREKARSKEGDR